MRAISRKIVAVGALTALLGFGTKANASTANSVEFRPDNPADLADLGYDGYSVLNASTTRAILVTAPLGLKTIRGTETVSVEVYVNNGTDGRAMTCSVFGHSVLTGTEHSGTASTTGHGNQTITVSVTANTGSSGDGTLFILQCNIPKGGTHKIYGAYSFVMSR